MDQNECRIVCPHCRVKLDLSVCPKPIRSATWETLAAEPAKVERGWVRACDDNGKTYYWNELSRTWYTSITHDGVYFDKSRASFPSNWGINHRVLPTHRMNGLWLLSDDDKPEPAKVEEPERDRHRRKIIKREGHAMIVETDKSPHDLRCCTISDLSGDLWFACDEPKWHKEHSPKTCVYLLGEAMENLSKAAATPLPSEKPAEAKMPFPDLSAALEAAWPDKSKPQPGSPRWTVELEQRIQDLNARLAKVEGKNGTN